jgi:hypothetical protein
MLLSAVIFENPRLSNHSLRSLQHRRKASCGLTENKECRTTETLKFTICDTYGINFRLTIYFSEISVAK